MECPCSHVPNSETERVPMEVDAGIGIITFSNVDELFEYLEI
ncbi:MAG: hypothetical protein PHC99_12590 [Methylococcales bacterium]|nr:hypothetical protein [Methylococcales bacterium]